MSGAHAEIAALVRTYLDGLYHCDLGRLGAVFHPQALYATAAGEAPLLLKLDEYLPQVAQRDPPARLGAPRHEEVLAIDLAGPATAMVKLRCRFFGRDYVDFLSVVRFDGRWQIVAKVFHFDPVPTDGRPGGEALTPR